MTKFLFTLLVLTVAPLLLIACDEGDSVTADGASSDDTLDRSELLGNIEDFRAILASSASGIDPSIVEDVDYGDGRLAVRLGPGQDSQPAETLEALCDDFSTAVALSDLEVVLEKSDGSVAAECSFEG